MTVGERLRKAWRRSPPLDPSSPGLTRPTLSPTGSLPPLHPQPRLYFLSAFMAPSFHPSLRSDVTAGGQGLRLGPCLAHLATLGGQTWGQGPTSAAGLRVPGRWAATTHPLGVHLSRETVRRFQARAKVRLSVRGSRRPASARHVVRSAGSLSGSLGPSVPPPARPQPLWALRLVAYGCHSALPAGATGRAGAAALRCERIKTSRGCGLSCVFQRLLWPGALLQTGLGAPAFCFQDSLEKVDLRCNWEWCQLPQPS